MIAAIKQIVGELIWRCLSGQVSQQLIAIPSAITLNNSGNVVNNALHQ